MADYNPRELAALLRQIPGAVTQAIETEQTPATIDMQGDIILHVNNEGKRTDGTDIGQYSTTPIHISIAEAQARYGSQIPISKLKPRGAKTKGIAATFRVVNEDGEQVGVTRKSAYFPDGWKGFRNAMGRDTSKVNLKLTGQLSGSIETGTNGNVTTIAFTNEFAAKKARGNEEHFTGSTNTIYYPTEGMIEALHDRLVEAGNRAIDAILKK